MGKAHRRKILFARVATDIHLSPFPRTETTSSLVFRRRKITPRVPKSGDKDSRGCEVTSEELRSFARAEETAEKLNGRGKAHKFAHEMRVLLILCFIEELLS